LLLQELFHIVATPLNRKMTSPLDTPTNFLAIYGYCSTPYCKG